MTAARLTPALLAALLPVLAPLGRAQDADRAGIERLLHELDDLFQRGDIAGYLARFEPDEPGSLAMRGRHLRRLIQLGRVRRRASTIVQGPHTIGERSLVRVRHVMHFPGRTDIAEGGLVEDSYLAVRCDGADTVVPTFAIEVPPATRCVEGGRLRCPPCNYEIGGVDGFLCVPLRRSRTLALEAASFYLLGTDVVCDVSVRVDARQTPAAEVAQQLAGAFHRIEPDARIGVPDRWRPPMHAASPPPGMDSARLVVEVPSADGRESGCRTIFHVVTFGGLQHLLLLRGRASSLARHRDRVEALFQSYMLLELDCSEAQAAARPLRHHTGGVLDGTTYRNELFDVEMHGPDGWHAEQRVGGAAFRVRWTGPKHGQLWLSGLRVPDGVPAWNRRLADRWIAHHLRKHGLAIDDDAEDDGGWHEQADGSLTRTCVVLQEHPERPDSPARRVLHLALRPDLLLLADGYARTDRQERALRAAIATLRRR